MGSRYSVHGNLSVTGYFLAFFADLCNFFRHFLSFRTIAQTFLLWSSLQFLWLYKGHSGYCLDISISWVCLYIALLNNNKTKCNENPGRIICRRIVFRISNDLQFTHFSDMSIEHRILLRGKIYALLQISKLWVILRFSGGGTLIILPSFLQ